MSEFLLRHEKPPELKKWVHIKDFALQKNNQVRANSFDHTGLECMRFWSVGYEKFDWFFRSENDTAFPTDSIIILHQQKPGAGKTFFESGSFYWLNRYLDFENPGCKHSPGIMRDRYTQEFISTWKKLFHSIWPDAGLSRHNKKNRNGEGSTFQSTTTIIFIKQKLYQ